MKEGAILVPFYRGRKDRAKSRCPRWTKKWGVTSLWSADQSHLRDFDVALRDGVDNSRTHCSVSLWLSSRVAGLFLFSENVRQKRLPAAADTVLPSPLALSMERLSHPDFLLAWVFCSASSLLL